MLEGLKKMVNKVLDKDNSEFIEIIDSTFKEAKKETNYWYDFNVIKSETYIGKVSQFDNEKKIQFTLFCIKDLLDNLTKDRSGYADMTSKARIRISYIQNSFKTKLTLRESDIQSIIGSVYNHPKNNWVHFTDWQWNYFLNQIIRQFKNQSLSNDSIVVFELMKKALNQYEYSSTHKEIIKLVHKLDELIGSTGSASIQPVLFLGNDDLKSFANDLIASRPEAERNIWYQLIARAQKASSSKPSQKYLDESKALILQLGTEQFMKTLFELFDFVIKNKEKVQETNYQYSDGRTYTYRTYEFLSSVNLDIIKGFVWMCANFSDTSLILKVSQLTERSFKKIPEKGPAAAAVGNAGLYTLFKSEGLEGIGQLSRLKLKIKNNSTLNLIDKYITEAAEQRNISTYEIEDLAVDNYGFQDDKRTFVFESYTATITLTGIGKSVVQWFKEDGKEQKSAPSFVKEQYAEQLKNLKTIQKLADQATSSQKERLDRMLRSDRTFSIHYLKDRYLSHPVLGFVVRNVIFEFLSETNKTTAIQMNGQWFSSDLAPINIDEYTTARLWHPAISDVENIRQWREFLFTHQIVQPFKQAFREIYLLTDAEIRTNIYSNRMAAHILRQHQFVTLAKGRNWQAQLQGAWDGGYGSDQATLTLPEYNIRVEFWYNPVDSNDEFNQTGIWNYVSTDQIRFIDISTNQPIELSKIPVILFSEALRDVDLFVGVASVGNDPTWMDSGNERRFHSYWESYSFGDLSEQAKNRKQILERLIPRLKIAVVTTVRDKFVVVKGKLRTYKIHIGSSNILMEPNDQYLCIVPDKSMEKGSDKVFIPFEGDNILSIIISKAMLLAEDDKIKDSTITSQISGK